MYQWNLTVLVELNELRLSPTFELPFSMSLTYFLLLGEVLLS